jgi:hypothetical protein
MAAKRYTTCVSASSYVDLSFTAVGFRNIFLMLLSGGFLAWLAVVIVGGPAILYAIALFTSAVIYLDWWLHGRLICLGLDECIVGIIAGLGPANPVEKGGDNDFSMNLLLAPAPITYAEQKKEYWDALPQGRFVKEHPDILAIGRAYVQDEGHKKYVVSIHSEFEGDGIEVLLKWAKVILALLLASLIVPPVIKAILILLAIFLTLVNVLDVLTAPPGFPGAGDPRDIDPLLGLAKGDIVAVKGSWVYDSLHHGWNEIHPVTACEVVGRMPLPDLNVIADPRTPWPSEFESAAKVQTFIDEWCHAITAADDAEDGGSREDPTNGWVIHPLVDGCKPSPIIL